MKIVLFIAGIMVGLCFNHLPRMELFHDWPETDKDWEPKATGPWSEEDRATIDRYFNGGKG